MIISIKSEANNMFINNVQTPLEANKPTKEPGIWYATMLNNILKKYKVRQINPAPPPIIINIKLFIEQSMAAALLQAYFLY